MDNKKAPEGADEDLMKLYKRAIYAQTKDVVLDINTNIEEANEMYNQIKDKTLRDILSIAELIKIIACNRKSF